MTNYNGRTVSLTYFTSCQCEAQCLLMCEMLYVCSVSKGRHGHYEALDLSCKSLPGDKVLIFSMCTEEEAQIILQSKSFKSIGTYFHTFACLRCSFLVLSDLTPA